MNTLLIILSYTFHPFATHNYMQTHSIFFRLFANIFFSLLIGMSWAFIGSYSLKEQVSNAVNVEITSRDSMENEVINHSSSNSVLPIDNFDILMMVLPPIVSYLMAETFSISGLLAIMCCAFLQSMYASSNLPRERSNLLSNTFKALSYTFRSICDIMVGISFPLHFYVFLEGLIGPWTLVLTLITIYLVSFSTSYLVLKKFNKLLKCNLEWMLIFFQNNLRGLLGFTLAL